MVVVVAAGRESWAFLARSAVPISSIAPPSSSLLSTSNARMHEQATYYPSASSISTTTTPHDTLTGPCPPPVANEGARQTESRTAGPGVDMPRGLYPSLSQNTSTSRYVISTCELCCVLIHPCPRACACARILHLLTTPSLPSDPSQAEEPSRHHHNPKPPAHHTTPPSSPLPTPAAPPPPFLHLRPEAG